MKGLILSGGKGTRLRPFTYTGAKQLVPVANKPVLFYAIEHLVQAGVTDIGIIISPETGEQIKTAVGDGSQFGAYVTYILQDAPLGLAHGVKIARSFVGDERFTLFLGDNFIRAGIVEQVNTFRNGTMNCQIMLYKMPHPQNLGVALLDGDNRVQQLIEKPDHFVSDLVLVGIYMFDHHIFQAIDQIQPSKRGELEITHAIQKLIDLGYDVRHHMLTGDWIDTGKMSDMLEANRLVLDILESKNQGTVDSSSRIEGRVVLQKGAVVVNSTIRGPAIIGENTRIENAFVGPYTSIYHDCVVQHCEIENSVVLEHAAMVDVPARVADSLIGRHAHVGRADGHTKTLRIMIGDHSKIGL